MIPRIGALGSSDLGHEVRERMLVVPASVIAKMNDEFYKIVGVASKVILKEVGKSFGESVAEAVEEMMGGGERNTENLINAIVNYLEKSGFGEVHAENDGNKFIITIRGAPSMVIGMKSSSGAVACYFEEGVVKGIMERIIGKKVKTKRSLKEGCCIITVEAP